MPPACIRGNFKTEVLEGGIVSASDNLALAILNALDIAVLRRVGAYEYRFCGEPPAFYSRLFPKEGDRHCLTPWRHSDMLEFFLNDAELFFSRNAIGSLSSGIWQEDGVQSSKQALLATAMCFGSEQVLILRMLSDEFVDRTRILQKAREQLLERRELRNNLETYKHKARTDALTSLDNRAAFMEALAAATVRAAEQNEALSLLLLDIDDFKGINDVYGHLTGDSVLAALGKLLQDLLRRGDMACRYGGEEFAILAPHTMQHQAMRMAEKLRATIAGHSFGELPPVTVSIGCATYRMGESQESLIQRADLALYDAKRNGKNMVKMR